MSLTAFDIPAIEDAPLAVARLELVPERGDIAAASQSRRPAARLDLIPQHGLQALPPRPGAGFIAGLVAAALTLHAGFLVLFALLLDWRVLERTTEREIPVEIVSQVPDRPKSPAKAVQTAPAQAEAGPGAPPDRAASGQPAAASPPPPLMVAPPPEPMRAATQAQQNRPAVVAPEAPKSDQPAPPPMPAPRVLASVEGNSSVPDAAKVKPDAAPQRTPTPPEPKPRATADLAAALPMDFSGVPMSFRAILSGSGARASEEYKGLVFGRLGRSQGAVERARALHLHGQVIVSFSVDDQGRVVDLKVAASSGTPAVDSVALDMIREAAPFPPPPPGTKRTFTPALSFGDE